MNYQSLIQIEMILFSAISSSVEQKTKKTACAFCNYNGKLVGCHQTVRRLQNSRFFFFSKSVKKSVKRGVRVLGARSTRGERKSVSQRLSPLSLSVFSLVPDLLFDCSRVLEYAKNTDCSTVQTVCVLFFQAVNSLKKAVASQQRTRRSVSLSCFD